MSRYHRVGPGIWTQPWTDDARLLALYLLTSEHRTAEGLFRLPTAYVAEDMRWDVDRIENAYGELEHDGFVRRDLGAKVVLIVNALQWQAPANDNGVKAAVRKLGELPATPLLRELLDQADKHCERLAIGMREHLSQRLDSTCAEPLSSTSGTPLAPPPPPSPVTALSGEPDGEVADIRQKMRTADVEDVFVAWMTSREEHHGRKLTAKLDDKRRKIIKRALASHGLVDVLDAVTGWRYSPHHRGENASGVVYDDLGLLLRDAAQIEKFRDLARTKPRHLAAVNGGRRGPDEDGPLSAFLGSES